MKQIISFFKNLPIARILTIFVVGFALFLTTACSTGDMKGAHPDNPAVQMGGSNNPYKGGGDSYTKYRFSEDAKADTNVAPDRS
jgi:hypothetical protein